MFEKTGSYQPFCKSYFSGDDDKVRFNTGLPCFSVLKTTFNHVAPHVDRSSKSLMQFQEFILVLIRLRLNVFLQDLASNLLARAQTFSNYKHYNTIKVLIGITP